MQTTKCPYTYPHRSKSGMIQYLTSHDSYGGWNHPNRGWSPLSWNVKLYSFKTDGKQGDSKPNEALDDAWGQYTEQNPELFNWIVEDMQRTYAEGEYTTYPGNDQGDWEFCFAGRSGGHMLLQTWKNSWANVDFLRDFSSEAEWGQWLDGLSFKNLQRLYRAVRCMDQDFTRTKINQEAEYQMSFRRQEWESEQSESELMACRDIATL